MDPSEPPSWHAQKQELQTAERRDIRYKEREIWWCAIGQNIGDEENGKGDKWTRPVLIVKKFNKHLFLGVPLTTQIKENPHYYHFRLKDVEQCAMLSQLGKLDSKRLSSRIGTMPEGDFEKVKERLIKYLI